MSHTKSRQKSGWDEIINSAKEMLKRVEAKAQRLKTDIEMMEESRTAGEPIMAIACNPLSSDVPATR
jgi:hypothetical protein